MRRIDSRTGLWCLFGALIVLAGSILIPACDLALRPLFGFRYCVTGIKNNALALERLRARDLELRIHEAELRLAEKPACPKPPPKPSPAPLPPPVPEPQPEPKPGEAERLKIPKRISELKGCWESVSGEIPIVSDDEEQRPIGSVRKCYCFNEAGRGQLKLLYTDGAKCRGPISARIAGTALQIHQPAFRCAWHGDNRGLVRSEINCHAGENESATCDTQNLGRNRTHREGDQYQQVPKDHCG